MPNAQPQLPRVLGPFDAMTVVVGGIIGSGIFLKPAVIAQELKGSGFALIIGVWIVMGLVTLCGALSLAELAAMLPHAGGPYVYLREAYGRLPAFLWGWTEFWVIRTGSVGALATATAIYLNEVVPMPRGAQEAVAIGIVLALSAASVVSTRWAAWIQNLTAVAKVGFLAVIIVLPYLYKSPGTNHLFPLWPESYSWSLWKGLGAAMIAVLWPYDGWINIAPVAEEIRDPQRNVPLALSLGVLLVIAIYVLANVAYHIVLPADAVASAPGGAVAAEMCQVLLGDVAAKFVAVGVLCSTFGAANSNLITGPRIFFAMARDGLLPAAVCKVHDRWRTPANAVLLQATWTVALIVVVFAWHGKSLDEDPAKTDGPAKTDSPQKLPQSNSLKSKSLDDGPAKSDAPQGPASPADVFEALTDFVIFGGSIFYAMAVGAVFVFRRTRPAAPRRYRTWGYPITPAVYLVAFSAALVNLLLQKPLESAAGSLLIAVGAVYYAVVSRRGVRANG
ncbi:MAG TPA: amino acid permease [Pirellulales bacterium]|jgi:APA family basic amino acid/polyamine antiporter|nr:amino acid permease [Pirellulales bacterium]